MASLTAHCLIKNEEIFLSYSVRSVIDFVDNVMIFDTGSTDKTVEIVKQLMQQYPGKIIFEEKGESDKKRHTELRQEMIERTTTDWIMILDGDEVWTKRAMSEVLDEINKGKVEVIESYFFECVGDVYHTHRKDGYKTVRFVRNRKIRWMGDYGSDFIGEIGGNAPVNLKRETTLLKNKFWHLTHLVRSTVKTDYSSGGQRGKKERLTYFVIGKKITEPIPEVFRDKDLKMSFGDALVNFVSLFFSKIS